MVFKSPLDPNCHSGSQVVLPALQVYYPGSKDHLRLPGSSFGQTNKKSWCTGTICRIIGPSSFEYWNRLFHVGTIWFTTRRRQIWGAGAQVLFDVFMAVVPWKWPPSQVYINKIVLIPRVSLGGVPWRNQRNKAHARYFQFFVASISPLSIFLFFPPFFTISSLIKSVNYGNCSVSIA